MSHLSKIKRWVWIIFAIVLFSLGGTTYFILTRKIEQYILIKIKVSKTGIDKIMMNSQDVIRINKSSKIRIRLMHKYYNVTIEEIEDKNDGQTEVTLKEKIPDFTIGSTMEARIIYSSIPV